MKLLLILFFLYQEWKKLFQLKVVPNICCTTAMGKKIHRKELCIRSVILSFLNFAAIKFTS